MHPNKEISALFSSAALFVFQHSLCADVGWLPLPHVAHVPSAVLMARAPKVAVQLVQLALPSIVPKPGRRNVRSDD